MPEQAHSTVREGLLTGTIGAVILAVWYLASDVLRGRLLHTPNVLGQVVLQGEPRPSVGAIDSGAVAGYTALHLIGFLLVGIVLAWAIHAALRHPTWRTGVWIGLVVGLGAVFTFLLMAPPLVRDAYLRWSVLLGVLVTGIAMLYYLVRRHPDLRRAVRRVEQPGPPHAPGGPRV